MIKVTKISGKQYYINPDLIEHIDTSPDTVLCLTTGKHLNVLETPEEVIDRIVTYRKRIYSDLPIVRRREIEETANTD